MSFLTFRNVNKTLLSPVNTEYQKRVFDSLSEVSKWLFAELKAGNRNYWLDNPPMGYIWEQMREQFKNNRNSVEKFGIEPSDINMSSEFKQLEKIADEMRYNPFLPKDLRESIVGYLDKRVQASFDAMECSFNAFMENLEGTKDYPKILNEEFFELTLNIDLENFYVDKISELGFSADDIEVRNKEFLTMIVEYLESFDPRKK